MPRIIRPPQVDDVWYVKVHHAACTQELDTVLITALTLETCLLVFLDEPPVNGKMHTARYQTRDVVWVELERVMPRLVESVPCQMTAPTNVTETTQLKPRPRDI